MKKIIFALLLGLFMNKGLHAQYSWQLQNSPVSSDLVSVWFADSLSEWIAAEDGTVLTTVNSGKLYQGISKSCGSIPLH